MKATYAAPCSRVSACIALALFTGACVGESEHPANVTGAAEPSVERRFLSKGTDDWEPSLAVGPDDAVHIIATRRIPVSPDARPPTPNQAVIWSSADGGRSFRPAVRPRSGAEFDGDPRIQVDDHGTVYATWVSFSLDETGRQLDKDVGGLMLATSRDGGETYHVRAVATHDSSVGDKPELAVSADGQDIYIAFLGPGTLDLVASHDGGESWQRHTIDPQLSKHWPTSIALAPNGHLYVTEPWMQGSREDPVISVAMRFWRSVDRGATWESEVLSSSPMAMGDPTENCAHRTQCPPMAGPYLGVAVDARNRVYVAYTEGGLGEARDVRFVRSDDNGTTWSEPRVVAAPMRPVSDDRAAAYIVQIVAAGDGLVYVTWIDDRGGPFNVWAKRSTDGGRNWSDDVRLSRTGQDGLTGYYGDYGGLAIDSGGALHAAWGEGIRRRRPPAGAEPETVPNEPAGGTWYARWEPER